MLTLLYNTVCTSSQSEMMGLVVTTKHGSVTVI